MKSQVRVEVSKTENYPRRSGKIEQRVLKTNYGCDKIVKTEVNRMLCKTIKKNLLAVLAGAYSLLVALFWLALRVNWAGISKAFGADKNQSFFVMQSPLIICVFLWLAFAFAFFSMLFWHRKLPSIISLVISGVFTVIIIVVIALGACDYMSFILPKFFRSLVVALGLIALALLLFFPPVSKCKLCTFAKCVLLACALLTCVLVGYNVKINYFTYGAVVYAVEDDYQIVFSTNAKSIAWVEVDGEKFYDLYAGSMKSKDLVHKVEVPQEKLNNAKSYEIFAQKMIYRGPFGGYKGKIISEQYDFRPVDSSDGLVYYNMSDVHSAGKGAVAAATSVENLDFLVLLGDMVSMVDSEYDAQYVNTVAYDVTHGEIPCVYVRGNHEIKGLYAEDLYKYVGSKNGNFYYWFALCDENAEKEVFGITLDFGEDHDDDWWEYYGTAQFVSYQNEQTQMLEEIIADNAFEGYNYKLVCSHIPVQLINTRGNHREIKNTWTALLNQIQPDLAVSGHQHELWAFLEGKIDKKESGQLIYNPQFKGDKLYNKNGGVTDFHFNSFIVGKRGSSQTDSVSSVNSSEHVGLAVNANVATASQICYYVNSYGEKVSVFQPFFDSSAQTEFVLSLKTQR